MPDKKIIQLPHIRCDEKMARDVKVLAEMKGVSEAEFIRGAIVREIEWFRSRYMQLHRIFGNPEHEGNGNDGEPCGYQMFDEDILG